MFCNNLIREQTFSLNREIDFLIAEDAKKITGCLGTLQSKSYCSEKNPTPKIVWLTNWISTRKGDLTGIKLLKYAEKHLEYDVIGTIGCNQIAQSLYKSLGYKCGKMQRLVSINPNKELLKIVRAPYDHETFNNIFSFKNGNRITKLVKLNSKADIESAIKLVNVQRILEASLLHIT